MSPDALYVLVSRPGGLAAALEAATLLPPPPVDESDVEALSVAPTHYAPECSAGCPTGAPSYRPTLH